MSVSAYEHHELLQFLKERWGPERATTIMELLRPVGWADVATKDDLTALGASLRGEIAEVRGEMRSMEGRLVAQISLSTRMLFFGTIASNATIAGLVLAAVSLT